MTTNQKLAKWVCMTIFVLAGTWASVNLFSWAWAHKVKGHQRTETSKVTAELRDRQLTCLARNIYYEAGGEPFEGKVAVAQVTINRAQVEGFPDDICAVVYQKNRFYDRILCQFSWVCQGGGQKLKPSNSEEYAESVIVARKVLLEGFRLPGLKDALYFHANYVNPGWKRERVAKIGRHVFYK